MILVVNQMKNNLKIEEGKNCGDYKIGKQTKISHKKIQYLTTSKILELIYMDLMGAIQVERLGGRRYVCVCVCVCVDKYSRYTLIGFLKEILTPLSHLKDHVNVFSVRKEVRLERLFGYKVTMKENLKTLVFHNSTLQKGLHMSSLH